MLYMPGLHCNRKRQIKISELLIENMSTVIKATTRNISNNCYENNKEHGKTLVLWETHTYVKSM